MRKYQFLFLFFLIAGPVAGQNSPFKKANRLYSQEQYADAIPHFIKNLEGHESSAALGKLARCYYKTNRISEADSVYQLLFARKRVADRYLKDYAEVLIQMGKYEQAVDTLEVYLHAYPEDEYALGLKESSEQTRDIPGYFPDVVLRPFLFNTLGDDAAGVILDDKIIYSADRAPDVAILSGKSGTTGRHYYRLFSVPFDQDPEGDEPVPYSSKLNAMRGNSCYASFNAAGTHVVFNRNSKESNRKGDFTMQILEASREPGGNWSDLDKLSFCTIAFNYFHPCLSAKGDTLLFASDKSGAIGGTDLFISIRDKNGQWSDPEPLTSRINTSQNEGFPFLHADGRLFFSSKGHGGFGGYDLFVCEKKDNGWAAPVNLGRPINSPKDDVAIFIDSDGTRGILTSSRLEQLDDLFILNFR